MTQAQVVHDLQANQRISALQVEVEELRTLVTATSGGGGSSDGKDMSDELTNHKIAASEARNETKIARLEGKIDLLASSINNLGLKIDSQRTEASSNRNVLISVIVAAAFALVALIYALITYGASTFYNGTVVRDIVRSEMAITPQKPTTTTPAH